MATWNSPLPRTAVEGADTHVDDHNRVRAALAELQSRAIDTDDVPDVEAPDMSGYATTQALGDVAATVPSTADMEAIALANALLNEEQPIVGAEIVDGVLVLTRRDGVQLTVEGSTSLAPSSVVWRLPWQSLLGSQSGGWLSRAGNIVTLRIFRPRVRHNSALISPPDGFKPFRARGESSLLEAHGATESGYQIGDGAFFWDDMLQAQIPEPLRTMVDSGEVDPETSEPIMTEETQRWTSITASWVTLDPMPAAAQTEDLDAALPLQVLP